MTKWKFDDPPNVAVVTTRSIVHDDAWIARVSHDAEDGGWQFHDHASGAPAADDAMVVALGSMVHRDKTLNELADLPEGWSAWREGPGAPWRRSKDREHRNALLRILWQALGQWRRARIGRP